MSGASRVRSTGLGVVVILTNVLIVALVAIGFSQRGFSGWWDTLRGDWQPPTVSDPYADDAEVTAPPTESEPEPTPMPSTSPSPTTEEPEPPWLAERFEEGEDLSVLVLGDRTGTHENDWVAAWARQLTGSRQVQLTSTLAEDPTRYGDPVGFGGEGPALDIDNASLVQGTPQYAAARLDLFVQDDPDLVLVSFGRANTPENLPEQLSDLQDELAQALPDTQVRYVVQPPRRDGQPPVTDTVREWAAEEDAEVIDVAQVFEDEGIVDATVSGRDPLSVNIFGGQRWAEIVQQAVFGGDQPAEDDAAPDDGAGAAPEVDEDAGGEVESAADDPTAAQGSSPQPAAPAAPPTGPTADPFPWQPPVSPWSPPSTPSPEPAPATPAPTAPTSPPRPTDPTEPTPTDPPTTEPEPSPTGPGPTERGPGPEPTDPETSGPDAAGLLSWRTAS
ncbi:SGNH/GDSL hydrolase family protein [uncultured Serinicoccus sp.]|uniref:SGNH/GDSL hydrolase family protein n=1 Tax=uncultured Serinicoccus sp. TaxID=735514 RepID=UPI002617B278|nr:SGNH/GDSL hydrolase family protein [uncultured Serinicoccus sp.]